MQQLLDSPTLFSSHKVSWEKWTPKKKKKNHLKISCQVTLSKEGAPKVRGLQLHLEGVVPSTNPPLYLDA